MFGPRAQDASDRSQEVRQLSGLLFQEGAHVRAGHRPGAALARDPGDLAQREAQPPSLSNEVEHAQDVSGVDAIPGSRPTCARNDAPRLVQAKSLAGDAAAFCYLTDEQAVRHALRIDLAPYGKVKAGVTLVIDACLRWGDADPEPGGALSESSAPLDAGSTR